MTHQHAVETLACERYLLNEMPELERYAFEAHFFECEECAGDVRLGNDLRRDASAIFDRDRAPLPAAASAAPVRRRRLSGSVALPWAAAVVLAAGLLHQMQRPPSLDEGARVFAPIPLRPATRSAVPFVPLPEPDGALSLALDVTAGTAGTPLTYQLVRDDSAAEVASGGAASPPPGTPLIVIVPASRLTPGATYLLRVAAGSDGRTPPLEYRFSIPAR
jgi:hypothetical protein